jgi:hypothetical protein
MVFWANQSRGADDANSSLIPFRTLEWHSEVKGINLQNERHRIVLTARMVENALTSASL